MSTPVAVAKKTPVVPVLPTVDVEMSSAATARTPLTSVNQVESNVQKQVTPVQKPVIKNTRVQVSHPSCTNVYQWCFFVEYTNTITVLGHWT